MTLGLCLFANTAQISLGRTDEDYIPKTEELLLSFASQLLHFEGGYAMSDDSLPQSEFILYQTEDGRTRIQCRFENEAMCVLQQGSQAMDEAKGI